MATLGHRIGPFELVARVASGKRTSLYRAISQGAARLPGEVAIRMADNPDETEVGEWIQREYAALREVNDPRFPRVYGYYEGQAALAMTWCEGVTLADVAQAHRDGLVPPSPATAWDVLVELATALRSAHALSGLDRPLIHGHFGAQRAVLTAEGEILVLGLGAQPHGRHPAYTPPEQAAEAFLDWRADQWALGAVGVELLTGQRLYHDAPDPRRAALEGDVERPVAAIEHQWPHLGRILRKMLAPAAGERFQQEAELLREMLAAQRGLEGNANRRALARQVGAFLDRLSARRPAPTAVQLPPADPAEIASLAPISPPLSSPLPPNLAASLPPGGLYAALSASAAAPHPTIIPLMDDPVFADPAPSARGPAPAEAEDAEVTAPLSAPAEAEVEPEVDPARARYQASEIAGLVLAVLFAISGVAYLLLRLWG